MVTPTTTMAEGTTMVDTIATGITTTVDTTIMAVTTTITDIDTIMEDATGHSLGDMATIDTETIIDDMDTIIIVTMALIPAASVIAAIEETVTHIADIHGSVMEEPVVEITIVPHTITLPLHNKEPVDIAVIETKGSS